MTDLSLDEICGYWPKHPVPGDEGIDMDVAVRDLLTLIKEIERLREVLQSLVDLQAGPPLEMTTQTWQSAMAKASRLLGDEAGARFYEQRKPGELPDLDSIDMTPVLGTIEHRLEVAMTAGIRYMRRWMAAKKEIERLQKRVDALENLRQAVIEAWWHEGDDEDDELCKAIHELEQGVSDG